MLRCSRQQQQQLAALSTDSKRVIWRAETHRSCLDEATGGKERGWGCGEEGGGDKKNNKNRWSGERKRLEIKPESHEAERMPGNWWQKGRWMKVRGDKHAADGSTRSLTGVVRVVSLHVRLLVPPDGMRGGGGSGTRPLGAVLIGAIAFGGGGCGGGGEGRARRPDVGGLLGRSGGEAPRVTGEVVGDLLDGLDGTGAHVNGHVLLDADGGFLAFALCHACGPARSSLPKQRNETKRKKKGGDNRASRLYSVRLLLFSWLDKSR